MGGNPELSFGLVIIWSLLSGCESFLWAYYKCLLNLKIRFSFVFLIRDRPLFRQMLSRV